jgi:hypothetical protein
VGLEEDAVDLGEVDGLEAISDGLEERAEAEVSDASEDAFGGACDEGEGVVGEDGVGEPGAIELGADEGEDVVGGELGEEDGVCRRRPSACPVPPRSPVTACPSVEVRTDRCAHHASRERNGRWPDSSPGPGWSPPGRARARITCGGSHQ